MRKIFVLFAIMIFCINGFGQKTMISSDSLLHYLQQADDIYACFDYDRKKDPVVSKFEPWTDEKDFYFNDSLKHILINLFNDSIGWARHTAKVVRQNLENDSEEDKRMALEGYLKRNYNKVFADSVLNNEKLFNQYFDSLCIYEEESSFKEDIKKRGTWNVPYSLKNIIAYSRYPEIYDKMLYYWKESGCSTRDFSFEYLLNVDCPEVIAMLETELDNNICRTETYNYLRQYRSEAIRLLIKCIDQDYLEYVSLLEFEIPFNVKIFAYDYHSWWMWYPFFTDEQQSDFYIKTTELIDKLRDIHYNDYKICEQLSKEIIENKQYIVPFLESAYQKCLSEELYWKQNMPYYKKVIEQEEK